MPTDSLGGLQKKTNVTVLTTNHTEYHETIVPQPVQALGFTILRIRKLRLPGAFTKRAKESREQIGSPWGYFYHLLTRMRGSDPKGMTTGSAPVSLPVLGNNLSCQKEQSVKSS